MDKETVWTDLEVLHRGRSCGNQSRESPVSSWTPPPPHDQFSHRFHQNHHEPVPGSGSADWFFLDVFTLTNPKSQRAAALLPEPRRGNFRLVSRDADSAKMGFIEWNKAAEETVNTAAVLNSNERVVSGYFVNVWEVGEALSGCRWTECASARPAGLARLIAAFRYLHHFPSFSQRATASVSCLLAVFFSPPPQTHTRPVVLQQKESLIRHSAAGNYLHLFKLLFMAFV